ncbi:hypothetical protein HRU87_05310 [Aquiluna borgnonia]|uniref:ScoMcrA-like SRA domain-containing protein n=1 Tax=Aquiluna borgnonia TaxID=2499157 RepID=A0A7D4QBY0_9MICO|nr:hypothetical protein [Aquiluna borgnonia]QKJ25590.1 hypothetical protein HRU87_05310 [Aquiluna borgnonia]
MDLRVGEVYLRSELHQRFGGNPRAGICPTKSGMVLVFSDPASGAPFGYDIHDEVVSGIYRYTGEGRSSNQQFVRGNKAMLSGDLRLFARVDAKSWIYVGEVALADPPFELCQAPDQRGEEREVIVFHLQALNADFSLL